MQAGLFDGLIGDEVDLTHYTATELKRLCKVNCLPQGGNKSALMERLRGGATEDSRGDGREIAHGARKKYDVFAMNASGNASTTFIGIESSVCYVDLGLGHIDEMAWIPAAKKILNLQDGRGVERSPGGFAPRLTTDNRAEFAMDLPQGVHGHFAHEELPLAGRERLRANYDAILAYLVPQKEHGYSSEPAEESVQNLRNAERMVAVAERSLVAESGGGGMGSGGSGSLLLATGRLGLHHVLALVERMDGCKTHSHC